MPSAEFIKSPVKKMNEALPLLLVFVAGILLGLFFFGGLWWTIRRGLRSQRPELWFIGSLLFRTLLVVGGFFWLASDDWRKLLACLTGFIAIRIVLLRLTRSESSKLTTPVEE